ncbi:MAG: hypothetical protein PHE79_06515 [Eubacteriales bacterium]|nr:hypothetical protein [Eubacteriales bacterium]
MKVICVADNVAVTHKFYDEVISMTDAGLKNLLGFLLRNKDWIFSLLDKFNPEDIENGMISIPDSIINHDLKMQIIEKADPYLNDYMVSFQQDSIVLNLDIDGQKLGRLSAKYMLNVTRFDFYDDLHQLQFSFKENVSSRGNFMQIMAMKAAAIKGSYLQLAAEMAKLNFLLVEKDRITIDIDVLDRAKKIPPSLRIDYISSEDRTLKLKFHI